MEKANYRTELDALNALVDEQRKTNELLEKLQPQPVDVKESHIQQPKKEEVTHRRQRMVK